MKEVAICLYRPMCLRAGATLALRPLLVFNLAIRARQRPSGLHEVESHGSRSALLCFS